MAVTFVRKVAGEKVVFTSHDRIDCDEIAALCLILKFGSKQFLDTYAPDRKIALGTGGGYFDEHRLTEVDERTCLDLTAQALDLTDDPRLQTVFNFVSQNDNNAVGSHKWISSVVKHLHDYVYPNAPVTVVNWALRGFEAKLMDPNPENKDFSIKRLYEVMRQFPGKFRKADDWLLEGQGAIEAADKEFKRVRDYLRRNAGRQTVQHRNQQLTVMWCAVDSPAANKAARSLNAAILIQMKSAGHALIMTDKRFKIDMRDPVRTINILEQRARGRQTVTDFETLESAGTVAAVGNWYYFKRGQCLFNGTLTHPAEPTALRFYDIVSAVILALDDTRFHKKHAEKCRQGICAGKQCHFYPLGLIRCRQIRYKMSAAKKSQAEYA